MDDDQETIDERGGQLGAPSRPSAGRFVLSSPLGRGGMGEVIEAHDDQLGRSVAIKRMLRTDPNDRQVARFLREARIQARLDHPAVVPVYELGRDGDGRPFFAMKKLAGRTMTSFLVEPDAAHSRPRLLRAFVDVCLAVELAHQRGIIHRDLKPDNIMLGDYGEVYVLDWGVAKVIGQDDGDLLGIGSGESATVAGTAIGTPGYMSPEQADGQEIDATSDIYALGCVLFEILALVPRRLGDELRPSERSPDRTIPPELDDLCALAVEPDHTKRLRSARELANRVQQYLDGDRDLALRRRLAAEMLGSAKAALVRGDHKTALREAGRALTLDPAVPGGTELVTRGLLEAPATRPPEVTAKMAADDRQARRTTARLVLLGHIGYLSFIPVIAQSASLATLAFVLAVILVSATTMQIAGRRGPAAIGYTNFIMQGVVTVVIARLFSPILVAPGLATIIVIFALVDPAFDRMRTAIAFSAYMLAAVLGPLILEQLGWISPTLDLSHGQLVLHALGLGNVTGVEFVLFGYIVSFLAFAAASTIALRRSERAAKWAQLTLTWQLRQLAPELPL